MKYFTVARFAQQKALQSLTTTFAIYKLLGGRGSLTIHTEAGASSALHVRARSVAVVENAFTSFKDIAQHYDVFILNSIFEGYPSVLAEAKLLGLPSIASACPTGVIEILEPSCLSPKDLQESIAPFRVCEFGIAYKSTNDTDLPNYALLKALEATPRHLPIIDRNLAATQCEMTNDEAIEEWSNFLRK